MNEKVELFKVVDELFYFVDELHEMVVYSQCFDHVINHWLKINMSLYAENQHSDNSLA